MIIGVPKEIKIDENRVAITPGAVTAFVNKGHQEMCIRDSHGTAPNSLPLTQNSVDSNMIYLIVFGQCFSDLRLLTSDL